MKTFIALSILITSLQAHAQHGDPGGRGGKGFMPTTDEAVALKTEGQESLLDQPNRIKLVFIAEGFSRQNKQEFLRQAQAKWDYIVGNRALKQPGVAPLRTYRDYFTPIALFAESKRDGSCHPERGDTCTPPKAGEDGPTAFGAAYGTSGMTRLIALSESGTERVLNTLRARVPDYKLAAVLVNDPEFGGGGGKFPLVSLHSESNETLVHQLLGHSLGQLGDEYGDEYAGFGDTEEPNVTKDPDVKSPNHKWYAHTIARVDQEDVLTQPYEGAHYHATGWYRPFRSCKMRRASSEEKFCAICREAIVRAIYSKVRPIDATESLPLSRTKDTVRAAAGSAWGMKVVTLRPYQAETSPAKMNVQWSIGQSGCDSAQPIEGATTEVISSDHPAMRGLKKGHYRICAKVWDTQADVIPAPGAMTNPLEQVQPFDLTLL